MQTVKMSADMVDVARRAADRWYVTVGDTAVGPVNLDLLARGVEAGKVPLEAFVRHEQWKVWRPLVELAEIERDSSSPIQEATDDIDEGAPSLPGAPRSSASLPSHASDQREALLLLMTAAVVRGGADAALVHE